MEKDTVKKPPGEKKKKKTENGSVHAQVAAAQVGDILSVLLAFRFINSLFVKTFFQPDEYFQALEPAWRMAFGEGSGAWMTWEWQHQLRSSLHPAIFGVAYKLAETVMSAMHLFPPFKAFMLVALPGALQSVFAALGDFYTWKLAMDIYGRESYAPWAALWMTVLNPWQWYCSTRTFSNSLETTLTIAALSYWPWELLGDAKENKEEPLKQQGRVTSLRISLILAAIAVLLRPTNLFIWLGVITITLTRLTLDGQSPIKQTTLLVLLREVILCGSAALAVSVISDRLYFGFWTFPPYKWLYFNMSQSLAIFYGRMPWHYYLSQGIPLLTTTFLPFALLGIYKTTFASAKPTTLLSARPTSLSTTASNTLKTLSFALVVMISVLSLISHKEVRFIYPLLPILHILAAPYITSFFTSPSPPSPSNSQPATLTLRHKIFLINLLSINLLLAGYLSLFHQPAPISVLSFLRSEYERLHPDSLSLSLTPPTTSPSQQHELFALFLTPCHTTPWRSHLVWPCLRARALTCEPPLHTAPNTPERENYLDEADRFYLVEDPETGGYGKGFLKGEMWPQFFNKDNTQKGEEVPRYIVGFEGIGDILEEFFAGEGKDMGVRLEKVWEGWNGVFSDDWRRGGRLVVWDTGVYPGSGKGERVVEEGRLGGEEGGRDEL
ncbi:Alg9-like mannosyltransferase family-domain-containing protein [Apiosordaria backusii]|uniref:Mannosyltransferase n=1 Tax=Apiosordaria backusii TaxID=314023 RepID=A0AA40F0J7_9PEZI|nr:Alg9-like mannosyltransferase family-domain-containing protein [Apiosordaria backusii]